MQEDIENKSLTLIINTSKLTARTLATAFMKFLRYSRNKIHERQNVKPQGKQSVRQLIAQNQGVENTELADRNEAKSFDRYARQYGVDYAIRKVEGDKPRVLVFFKARDSDALTAALKELASTKARTRSERPSVLQRLEKAKEQTAKTIGKIRNREPSR